MLVCCFNIISMIAGRTWCGISQGLVRRTLFAYHTEDLIRKAHLPKHTLIFSPANRLYIDKVLQDKFNEKKYIFVLQEQQKTDIEPETVDRLFRFAHENREKILFLKTISNIMSMAYFFNYKNSELLYQIGKRGMQIIANNDAANKSEFSYVITKFLIGCSRMFGLARFSNEELQYIMIEKLKPLFIVYVLEMFWREGVAEKYPFVTKLMVMLERYQHYLSFADVHHLLMVKKVIKDPAFFQITQNLEGKLRQITHTNQQEGDEKEISPVVVSTVFQNYMNDLKSQYL